MASLWKRIFGDDMKEFQTTKSGDHHFSLLKIDGEVIMAIAEGPVSSAGGYDIGVGAGVSVADVSGNVQIGRRKEISYGKPIVLFNANNKAGLKPIDAIEEVKRTLPEAQKNEVVKTDINSISEDNVILLEKEQSLAIGSSVLQIKNNETISIVRTPNIAEEGIHFLRLLLQFLVVSLLGKEGIYRANIMFLDPPNRRLKIRAHYNMDGYQDVNVELKPDEGGAGKALQTDSIQRVDLKVQRHEEYHVPSQKIWDENEEYLFNTNT